MKIFLCGGASGNQISKALLNFSKVLDKTKPILYIPLAMDKSKYDDCYKWFKEEIKFMNHNKFEMVKSSKELSTKNLYDYSGLYIGGGNTYKLLDEIKQNSNYEKLLDYINNNGIIFGGSAGAIIFGKDINSCMLDDKDNINLKDTSGFNIINNYSILCHLKNKNLKKNLEYLRDYSITNKVIYLPEKDVILIEDNKIRIIGNEKYMIFNNGEYVYHHFANFKKDIKKD